MSLVFLNPLAREYVPPVRPKHIAKYIPRFIPRSVINNKFKFNPRASEFIPNKK